MRAGDTEQTSSLFSVNKSGKPEAGIPASLVNGVELAVARAASGPPWLRGRGGGSDHVWALASCAGAAPHAGGLVGTSARKCCVVAACLVPR